LSSISKEKSFFFTCIYNKQVLVGDQLLLRHFGPYRIILMTACLRFHRHS
jgi:hypothetical protein